MHYWSDIVPASCAAYSRIFYGLEMISPITIGRKEEKNNGSFHQQSRIESMSMLWRSHDTLLDAKLDWHHIHKDKTSNFAWISIDWNLELWNRKRVTITFKDCRRHLLVLQANNGSFSKSIWSVCPKNCTPSASADCRGYTF